MYLFIITLITNVIINSELKNVGYGLSSFICLISSPFVYEIIKNIKKNSVGPTVNETTPVVPFQNKRSLSTIDENRSKSY